MTLYVLRFEHEYPFGDTHPIKPDEKKKNMNIHEKMNHPENRKTGV